MKGLILFVAVMVVNIFVTVDSYVSPTPLVELLNPTGFRVSIPDAPGIELFAFHGNINEELEGVDAGEYSGDVYRQKNGRWTYKNKFASIGDGDVLYFWTMVHVYGRGYQKLYQQYHVPGNCIRKDDDTISPTVIGG